jgi:YtkA-like
VNDSRCRLRLGLPLLAGLWAGGPGGAAQQGFLDTPLLTVASASGALQVAVFSDPQPPVRGNLAVRYRITDAASAPVDGLTLLVVPWMVAMGHGSSVKPTVTARGAGVYDLSNVYLFMPGQWELRTTVGGAASDDVTPNLTVQ